MLSSHARHFQHTLVVKANASDSLSEAGTSDIVKTSHEYLAVFRAEMYGNGTHALGREMLVRNCTSTVLDDKHVLCDMLGF